MLGLRGRTWQPAFLPTAPNEAERVLYVKRRVWWLLPLVVCAFGGISYGFVRACLITGWFDVFLAYWAFACRVLPPCGTGQLLGEGF